MNKFEALMCTGKLEVHFTGEKKILEEVRFIQQCITENNRNKLAIALGRLEVLLKPYNEDVTKIMENLISYCIDPSSEISDTRNISIEDMDLSIRAFNCMKRSGFNVAADILKLNGEKLLRVRNLGVKSATEVIDKMKELGFEEWAEKTYEEFREIEMQKNS